MPKPASAQFVSFPHRKPLVSERRTTAMTKTSKTSDALHPARLLVTAAVSPTEFAKKFEPTITNTPALPKVDWGAIGKQPPQLSDTSSALPPADAVVITWADAEWAALQHVFCGSDTPMPYTKRNEGSWTGWIKYDDTVPSGLDYWGYYRLVQIGGANVLLFKSNTHYAASQGEQNLEELTNRFIEFVKPALILSIGTAGGARKTDPVGTVNVVQSDVLYESNQPQSSWPSYSSAWKPNWTVLNDKSFGKLLFPIPTTSNDIKSIATQFNQFYGSNYPLSELNPGNLNMGASEPAINNLTTAGTPLLTARSFVVANTSGNLANFACVEMDDAVIAKAAAGKTAFGSVRNVSDPIQNADLPDAFQGHWGEAIYTAYGIYTSYNGALAAWALLSAQFASGGATSKVAHQAAQAKPSVASTTHIPLKGSRRYQRSGSKVLGRSDRREWCEVMIKVRRKAALPEPDPDHPISRSDLVSKYGGDPRDLDLVEQELKTFGVSVTSKNPDVRAVNIAGPVTAMENALGVRLFKVAHEGLTYRGRVGEIFIPRRLDGIVTGVFGLDTRPMIKRRPRLALQTGGGTVPPANQRSWFFPTELADTYQFPVSDGAGQVVGILEFEGHYDAADLQQFWKLVGNAGAPPAVTVTNVETLSSTLANNEDGIGETMLDVEVVASVCPKAAIHVYVSGFTEKGWAANLDAALQDKPAPTVVSISYSFPEGLQPWTQQAVDQVNDSLKELADAGITVCVSTGDDGSSDAETDGMAHVGFPSTSPYVLAVGGTSLDRHSGAEVVWHDGNGVRPPNGTGGATGGGVSSMNPRPSWQSSINIASVNPHSLSGRIVPDVSADASANTGYRMFGPNPQAANPPSVWQTVGGTSAATPLWASLIARLQQLGKKVTFLTPRLYAPTPSTNGKSLGNFACRDITQGTNASGDAEGYAAGPGYDAASGWGSPNGGNLLKAL
jgi:kumamolisin